MGGKETSPWHRWLTTMVIHEVSEWRFIYVDKLKAERVHGT